MVRTAAMIPFVSPRMNLRRQKQTHHHGRTQGRPRLRWVGPTTWSRRAIVLCWCVECTAVMCERTKNACGACYCPDTTCFATNGNLTLQPYRTAVVPFCSRSRGALVPGGRFRPAFGKGILHERLQAGNFCFFQHSVALEPCLSCTNHDS